MGKKVLVVNAGSSSLKWTLFEIEGMIEIATGLSERINLDGKMIMDVNGKKVVKEASLPDHAVAVEELLKLWEENKVIDSLDEISLVGFRVVQGGNYFSDATSIGDEEVNKIDECSKYAPLHNPGAVAAIRAFQKILPNAKLSANFDTSFHTTIPKLYSTYPINKDLADKLKIKKFGMHGISHRFITLKMQEILNKDKVTFINLHIGNGASLCAIKDSKSIDTTMGLTPLAGVMMGTRSGDIDPSIHEFVMNETGMSIADFTKILNKESGLLGVSKVSSDMRDVQTAASKGNKDAEFAIDLYVQKIVDYTANFFNKLGGEIDGIVFTAGIGENSAAIREKVINKLKFRKLELSDANQKMASKLSNPLISTKNSEIDIYAISTNEELMIAKDAIRLGGK